MPASETFSKKIKVVPLSACHTLTFSTLLASLVNLCHISKDWNSFYLSHRAKLNTGGVWHCQHPQTCPRVLEHPSDHTPIANAKNRLGRMVLSVVPPLESALRSAPAQIFLQNTERFYSASTEVRLELLFVEVCFSCGFQQAILKVGFSFPPSTSVILKQSG